MTRKERHAVYEGIALVFSGAAVAFAAPSLISDHENVALLSGLMLLVGWASWAGYFAYRITKEK